MADPAPREHLLKIGVSGIRGVVGEFLTPALAGAFAQAFGTYVGAGRVVVGRDTRASGEMLQHAVTVRAAGGGLRGGRRGRAADADDPDLRRSDARARRHRPHGVAQSARVQRAEAVQRRRPFLQHYERGELIDLYHESDFRHATNAQIRRVSCDRETPSRLHIERVSRHVDGERIRRRQFRVALDAVNGAGSVMTCAFLRETLGCELEAIAVDPTQPFPRVAEPRPDTLGDLRSWSGARARRSASRRIRTATGWPSSMRPAACSTMTTCWRWPWTRRCDRMPGDVVVNLTTSAAIDEIAASHGRRVYRTPVGEANVVEMMQASERGHRRRRIERRHHFPRGAPVPRQLHRHGVFAGPDGGDG